MNQSAINHNVAFTGISEYSLQGVVSVLLFTINITNTVRYANLCLYNEIARRDVFPTYSELGYDITLYTIK